jgi:hypothetical protein
VSGINNSSASTASPTTEGEAILQWWGAEELCRTEGPSWNLGVATYCLWQKGCAGGWVRLGTDWAESWVERRPLASPAHEDLCGH